MMTMLRLIANGARALLDGGDAYAEVHAGAHRSAMSPWSPLNPPTKAQAAAGKYFTGQVLWQAMHVRIENPAHTVREGVGEDGKPWRNVMKAHYGFLNGTRGADGDGVDVFLGPFPESERVWVLNQRDASGAFDEHKVLAGFHDETAAVDAYRLSYTPGWDRYGPPIPLSLTQLRWWLQFADLTRELTLDLVPPEPKMNDDTNTPAAAPTLSRVFWDSAAEPTSGKTLGDVLYSIRASDAADGLVMDAMTMRDITEGAELIVLDALVTVAGKLKPKMEILLRVMEAASGEVKPLAMQLSEPMRRHGGVHVAALFELSDGQTITIWFHNPDSTPAKLTPMDDLVSWKWQLNKKDITIVVAPESGQDLNLREVARRIMRLATKNSPAFAKANSKRAAVMAEIDGLRTTLGERKVTLQGLMGQIEVARVEADDRAAKKAAGPALPFLMTKDGKVTIFDGDTAQPLPDEWTGICVDGAKGVKDFWYIGRSGGERAFTKLRADNLADANIEAQGVMAREAAEKAAEELRFNLEGWEQLVLSQLEAAGRTRTEAVAEFNADRAKMEGLFAAGWEPETVVSSVFGAKPAPAVEIPQQVKDRLNAILSRVNDLADGMARARQTDAKFGGSGRYGAETWRELNGDERLVTEAQVIEKTLAGIPDEANRAAAAAYIEENRARPAQTEQEAAYFGTATPKPAPTPDPIKTAADLGLEDASPEAVELLDGNDKPLATAKQIEAAVKASGGAVSWVATGVEPEAVVFDAVKEDDPKILLSKGFIAKVVAASKRKDKTGSSLSALHGLITNAKFGAAENKPLNEDGINALKNIIIVGLQQQFAAAGNLGKSLEIRDKWLPKLKEMNRADLIAVFNALRAGYGFKPVLDSLFELDGARFVRGDITYKSRAMGSVTVNGTGQAFFTKPDGTAFSGMPEEDEEAEDRRYAADEGLLGWTDKAELMVQYMLDPVERDIIDEEIASGVRAAENKADDDEQDGVSWPATILDKSNPYWQNTLNDLREKRGPGVPYAIGYLEKGSQTLIASAVYRGKNAAAWYIVLTKPGQRKMLENIPFPSITGAFKMGKVAAILMGYLDADEASGFKIAPPSAAAEGGDRNPMLVKVQEVRAELVKLGYVPDPNGEVLRLERDGAMHIVKWEYQGSEDAPTGFTFRVTKLVNGAQVDDFEGFNGLSGSTPEVSAINLDTYIRNMAAGPDPEEETPPTPTESAEAKFLREVGAGVHDALDLGDMLAKIEASVAAMQAAGQLAGDNDPVADAAILHWASLEEKANG